MPSYQRIAMDIRTKVASGKMAPGVMLPGRRDLAAEYGVSVPTIDRAVADLLAEGTLRSNLRRGTFVGSTGAAQIEEAEKQISDFPPSVPSVTPRSTLEESARNTTAFGMRSVAASRAALRAGTANISIGIVSRLPLAPTEAELTSHYSYTIISAVERAATRNGGRTHFRNLRLAPDVYAPSHEGYEALVQDGVDIVLLVNVFRPDHFPALFRAVETHRVPIIVVNADRVNPPFFSVHYDHALAAYQAARHLFEEGCRELIFFAARSAAWVEGRWQGTLDAARDSEIGEAAVLERIDRSVVEGEHGFYDLYHGGYELACRILDTEGGALLNGSRGVIAANDQMAIGFIKAASERGFAVGKDYVIIGFDDQPESRPLGLSTMRPPLEEIGREAVRLAVQVVEEVPSARRVCLYSQLVARSSSRFDSAARV